MQPGVERRHPERKRHTLRLLRQVAALSVLAAVGLFTVPRVLLHLGVIGPSTEERVAAAARAVEAARSYGATADRPAFAAAERDLVAARRLLAEGHGGEARRAAESATGHAVEAQRTALVDSQQTRNRAEAVVDELDREVNQIEELYSTVTPSLDKATVSELLSLMKKARETTGVLFLAKEDGKYDKVVAGEAHARQILAETRARLDTVRRPPSSPPGTH